MKLPRIFPPSNPEEASKDRYYLWIGLAACAVVLLMTVARGWGKTPTVAQANPGTERSVLSSAVDIKENDAQYTVTIALAGKDTSQINLRMDGDTLHFISGGSGGARYDQSFLLPKAAIGSTVTVNREKDRLVLNVPKASNPAAQPQIARNANPQLDPMNDRALKQMARMQRQMQALMAQAMQGTGVADPLSNSGVTALSAGLSGGGVMNLEEKSDKYLIHLQIPKEEQQNVKVAVDNDRVLKISAQQQATSGNANGGFQSFHTSNYSQVFTLPGPVQSDKIKMDSEGDSLLITLPKA